MSASPLARTDCHQHAWSPALVDALRSRTRSPRLEGWELLLEGEPPYAVRPADHDLAARRGRDSDDLTLLSLSSPLGIETLPPEESAPLLDVWHAGADGLEPGHALWAAPRLVEPDAAELAQVLARPRVAGLQVPATVMLTPTALERLAPVLRVAEEADRPVLVHPGPATGPTTGVPGWWGALTDYPAQLAAAWFAWHTAGRALLPRLRIGFVALAGLAPLHHERLAQRGGQLGRLDPGVFYDTSSYGRQAVDAMTRVVGVDVVLHGTDRPYAAASELGLGPAFDHAVHVTNPHHFLNGGSR